MAKAPKGNPFESLAALRDQLRPSAPQVDARDFPDEPPPDGPARAVLRLLHREGAPQTAVEELGLDEGALEQWRLALQRGLAANVTREGATLVAQGDHRLKLPDLLLRRGVKRVVQAR